jgi:hypothetical protein
MKALQLFFALTMVIFLTSTASAQTTMDFEGQNMINGDLVTMSGWWNPQPAYTTAGNRVLAAYPIIDKIGGQAHTQPSPPSGAPNFDNAGGVGRTEHPNNSNNHTLMFEHPRDYIEFGPFTTGVDAFNFGFTLYAFAGTSKGRVRVTMFYFNRSPVGNDSSGVSFEVSSSHFTTSSSTTIAQYPNAIPINGYVRITRESLWGSGSTTYPNGNFHIDDISYTNGTIPVEMTSFRSDVIDNTVRLQWTTATELNNYGFEIERSTDRENWEVLDFVSGHGTVFTPQKYTYIDKDPDWSNSVNFYRLRQIDRDGVWEYSSIVRADRASELPLSVDLTTFPQPFNNELQVQIRSQETQQLRITLFNSVLQSVATVFEGTAQGVVSVALPTADLLEGNYFLVVQSGNQKPLVRKILKVGSR